MSKKLVGQLRVTEAASTSVDFESNVYYNALFTIIICIRADVHAIFFISHPVFVCLIDRILSWIACYLVGKIITPASFGQHIEELVWSSILVFKNTQWLHN